MASREVYSFVIGLEIIRLILWVIFCAFLATSDPLPQYAHEMMAVSKLGALLIGFPYSPIFLYTAEHFTLLPESPLLVAIATAFTWAVGCSASLAYLNFRMKAEKKPCEVA